MQPTIITSAELAEASEGIISNLPAPTISGSLPPIEEDERDLIKPLPGERRWKTSRGTQYQRMEETRWVLGRLPADVSLSTTNPIFPEREIIREFIYDCNGVLIDILAKMGWHNASKGELMRWIGKLGLENDIMIARDGMIDQAESVVNRNLELQDVETAKFVLKTVGKKRGWNERIEDATVPRNVYQFINIASGRVGENLNVLDEAGLVKYLEEQLSQHKA